MRFSVEGNLYSSARLYRSLRDEFAELATSLAQARSFQNLGDRPPVVVTAERDAHAGWLPLQGRMAHCLRTAGTGSCRIHTMHLVTDQIIAKTSSQAVRDVVHAVRLAMNRSE
jgi:hypothetical protein